MFRNLTCAVSWLAAISLSSLLAPGQDAADPPGDPVGTAAQRQLVQQLGDASYRVRHEAARNLARQESAAKDVLTQALTDSDPEIRSRAQLLLDRLLQEVRAEDSVDRIADPVPSAAQRKLVQQLGAPTFSMREQAADKLRSQGAAGKAALVEALHDPDFEIRWQVRRVLNCVEEDEFEARLEAFIADVDGNEQFSLPGWKRFRDLVGSGRDARKMFVQMTRSEAALLSAYEEKSPELSEFFAARSSWLQSNCTSGNSDPRLIPQTMATLLLIGSDKTVKDHSRGLSPVYQLLSQTAVRQSISPRTHPSILRTLLEEWTTSTASSGSSYGMMVALKYDLEETGLQQATQLLERKITSTSTLHYAIIILGRFGGEQHIRLLKPLLENKTVCHRWSNTQLKKNGTIDVQVRDAALVVLLRMTGTDPGKFGFNLLRDNPETLYYVYTFGFIEEEEREAAHAKWAAESDADEG